ncbi:hypothetical protein HHI36_003486, partial [Cryptolaemus montrouzieri]
MARRASDRPIDVVPKPNDAWASLCFSLCDLCFVNNRADFPKSVRGKMTTSATLVKCVEIQVVDARPK